MAARISPGPENTPTLQLQRRRTKTKMSTCQLWFSNSDYSDALITNFSITWHNTDFKLTVAGVGDWARSREVKLDKSILTQANVSGDCITRVGLLYECKCRSVRPTDRHSSSSRVEKPRAPINGGEIIFQRPPAAGTSTYYYLQTDRCNKKVHLKETFQRLNNQK